MGWQDYINLDFDKLISDVIAVLFRVVRYPFDLLHKLPIWARWGLFSLILLFGLFVGWQLYNRRNEWREYTH